MIAALARAHLSCKTEKHLDAARGTADFVLNNLRRDDGRLLRYHKDGPGLVPAYADDYAFLVWGLLELYEADFELAHLETAVELNNDMLRLFWDEDAGGLYLYGDDAESLVARPRELYDGALPSANSVACHNLLRLSHITASPELEEKAYNLLESCGGNVKARPAAFTHLLSAADFALGPTREIVISGRRDDPNTEKLIDVVREHFLPRSVVLFLPREEDRDRLESVFGWTPEEGDREQPIVYICEDKVCEKPISDPDELADTLDQSE